MGMTPMPEIHLDQPTIVEPAVVVQETAHHKVLRHIGMTFLLVYISVTLIVMVKFYNSLSDTACQRAKARTALTHTLLTDPDNQTQDRTAYILDNLPPLKGC